MVRQRHSYRHLKVFGCHAYVHVQKDKWVKLKPKTCSCIFLGYRDDKFGYRIWDLATKKFIRCRDKVFMEEKTIINWEKEKSGSSYEFTERIHPDEERTQSTKSGMLAKEQSEPIESRQGSDSAEV